MSDFDDLVASVDSPMYVVTAAAGGEISGCLVGFATQTSIDPPRFTAWISRANHTAGIAARASHLVVHFLRESDHHLAEVFGELTGDDVDKFDLVEWTSTTDGAPAISGCDHFVGRIVVPIESDGDHRGYVLEPEAVVRVRRDTDQLGLQDAKDLDPGHPA